MPVCRLIVDGPEEGAWNMAADEALLDAAAHQPAWSLRFYRWSAPTLSLGYFQPCRSREEHLPSRQCAWTRRPSGGGAIVHDDELTYCLVAPADHPLARAPQGLYRAVHGAFVGALGELDVASRMYELGDVSFQAPVTPEPFLCFERRSPGDLLVGPAKIGGSAQRRRGGAVLQHGSFLLHRSSAAPELSGVEDLHPTGLAWEEWQSLLAAYLGSSLSLKFEPRPWSEQERRAATARAQTKYQNPDWNERR